MELESPIIKLNPNCKDEEIKECPKKPFNRNEYMKNYMREYMRKKNSQQKQKRIDDEAAMRKVAELMINIVNAYDDYFTPEQKMLIQNECDTGKNEISFILNVLVNEINKVKLF